MNDAAFDTQVQAARGRAFDLLQRAESAADKSVPHVLVEALEELGIAFEELTVAQEELRVQNEALAAAEAVAVAERDRFRDLFEFAPIGYLVTDAEGVIRQANRAAGVLLGTTARHLPGKPLAVFVCEPHRAAFRDQLTALQRGRPAWEQTLHLQPRNDAPPVAADLTVVPFRDPVTRAVLLRWQVRDVTAQWLAIQEVRRLNMDLEGRVADRTAALWREVGEHTAAERRLQFLTDAGADLAASIDPADTLAAVARQAVPALGDWCFIELTETDERRRVPLVLADWAAQAERVQAAMPRPTACDRVRVFANTAALPPDLTPAEAERAALIRDLGWPAAVWLPLTAGGERVGGLAVGAAGPRWDGPDRAVAEQFARQAAAAVRAAGLVRGLREADRLKDEFLATLAHELRNPLTPIRNAVRLLQLSVPGNDTITRPVGMIDRQMDRLTRLVDDLMDVARIARGKLRLRLTPVDLAAVAADAADAARARADARRVGLTVRLPADPVMVSADPLRLEQVLANLLDNAIKYTDADGRVSMAVGVEDGAATVRVRDTGVGLAPEVLPRVFDLFAQADESIRRTDAGLGIGLALVKQLTELHGGTVTAASDGPGRGSEFVVRLPVAADPSPAGRG